MALPVAPARRWPWILASGLVAAGIIALFVLAFVEARWLRTQPWHGAIRTEGYTIAHEDAIAAWSRTLPLDQSGGDSEIVDYIQRDLVRMAKLAAEEETAEPETGGAPVNPFDTAQMLDLSYLPRATLVMLDLPAAELESLLDTGRLPVAGEPEILAGALLSTRDLELDGETFSVVGTLRPQVPGFVKTYVLPAADRYQPLFTAEQGGTRGSLVRDATGRLKTLVPELFDRDAGTTPTILAGPVPTRTGVTWGVWGSLLAVATGASIGFIALYRRLALWRIPLLAPAMRETVLRPGVIGGLHFFLFGAFFGAMALGMRDPELNYLFMEYASHMFNEGALQYVGDAYASGNIASAAHATYANNFIWQTLVLSVGTSLAVPVFTGILKILASFLVVGFAMAPLWTDTASGMTYHAITLALELPPYILVGFGIWIWSECFLRFLWSPVRVWYLGDSARGEPIIQDAARQLPRGLAVLAGCTLLAAVLLYAAAWYEAATLILLR